jgi:hypothetical protein
MLYLGHFSFDAGDVDDDDEEAEDSGHGYFTVVASAETVADAFEKFKVLIPRIGRENELFESGTHVYLDACVEVKELPAEGLMSYAVVAVDDGHSVAASLLGAPTGAGQAYGWGSHDPDDEIASEAAPAVRVKPDSLDATNVTGGETEGQDEGEAEGGEADDDADDAGTRDISQAEPFLVVR